MIVGDDLDTTELLRSKNLVELLQDALAVAIRNPYDLIGVVINNDSDVLMALAIAGLINAYVDKPIEST